MNVSVADNNSVGSFEGDRLSCSRNDECKSDVQKTDKVKQKDVAEKDPPVLQKIKLSVETGPRRREIHVSEVQEKLNKVGSLEKDLLSCDIPDECCLPPKTTNKDNDKDEVCKEKCFDDEELEDDINKARSLSVVGWTVLKRYGGSYDLKKGIVDSYDVSTRFFKVKYRDGTMDTIVERVLLSCLGDPHERGFPHYLFLEPPLPEGEKPRRRHALRMRARARVHPRFLLRRLARAKDTGEYESSNDEEAEMGGSDDSSEEASVGSNGFQSAGGDDTDPAEHSSGVGSCTGSV